MGRMDWLGKAPDGYDKKSAADGWGLRDHLLEMVVGEDESIWILSREMPGGGKDRFEIAEEDAVFLMEELDMIPSWKHGVPGVIVYSALPMRA